MKTFLKYNKKTVNKRSTFITNYASLSLEVMFWHTDTMICGPGKLVCPSPLAGALNVDLFL